MGTIKIADKPTLDNVNTNVGGTGDSGASSSAGTLFGKLNKIISDIATFVGNWTATRAGYIDTIKTNTDRLTSARATKIDNIGATGDTGGTASAGTVMAKLNALVSNTTTNNTASKTGVLSAKLTYIISLLENTTYGLSAIKNALGNIGGGTYTIGDFITSHSDYKTSVSYSYPVYVLGQRLVIGGNDLDPDANGYFSNIPILVPPNTSISVNGWSGRYCRIYKAIKVN
jgi:hypothetical protein